MSYIDIAAGEHEHDFLGFRTLLGRDCVDVVQADVSHHGGLSGLSKIIDLCESVTPLLPFTIGGQP